MSEYIEKAKEDVRKRTLLTHFFNSNCDDNMVVYNVDFRKRPSDGDPKINIRYTMEFEISEDEFNKLIEKLES